MRRNGLGLLCFILASIVFLASQTTSASAATSTTHKSPTSNQSSVCDSTNALIIAYYNFGSRIWYDCSYGYTTPGLSNVTYIETVGNSGNYAWWKWYTSPSGKYCYVIGDGAHWSPPGGSAGVTQVDYGDPLPNPLPPGTSQQC